MRALHAGLRAVPFIRKICRNLLVCFLAALWIYSGWPQIPFTHFPQNIERAEGAEIAQYSGGLVVYADGTAGTPKYQTYDETNGFGTEQSASSVGASAIEWIRVAASPTKDEWIIATRDAGDVIKAQVCTGVDGGISCGSATTITATAGTHGLRNFDVEYEMQSGDALLVYGTATVDELRKIEWTGGSWTNDAAITTTRTSGTVEWVELTSRPASDQIGIVYSDDADDASAYRWSGTAVGNEATAAITVSAGTANSRKVDVSFEGTSGDMLVAVTEATAGTTATGALVGTTWTITSQTSPDNAGNYIDLQEPGPDNDIAMITHGALGANNPTEGYEWSGTAIVDAAVAVDTTTLLWAANYQAVSTAYVSSTYYAVAVFSDVTGADDINWWTMNSAGTWTVQADNLRTRGTMRFLKLYDYPNSDKVILFSSDANSDLWADTWNGSTPSSSIWTNITSGGAIETSLSSATTEVYDFAFRLYATPGVVTTGFASNVAATTAVLNGTRVAGSGGTQHGFAYSTDANLTTSVSTTTLGVYSGLGDFQGAISSLVANTAYYFRAYVTNTSGTYFGGTQPFSTGNTSLSRQMRLFEGYKIKLINNRIILRQK